MLALGEIEATGQPIMSLTSQPQITLNQYVIMRSLHVTDSQI